MIFSLVIERGIIQHSYGNDNEDATGIESFVSSRA